MLPEKDDCTGCSACFSVCPNNSIDMVEDERGFLYPFINKASCSLCGLCEEICPVISPRKEHQDIRELFAVWNKNDSIRKASTSGGVFNSIARYIIRNNGIVYGAIFDSKFKVVHNSIDNENDLYKLSGSKYVQSTIYKNIFSTIEIQLKQGRMVCFSGTPCQCIGLKHFLGEEYNNLLLVDFICHGVASPLIFKRYLYEYHDIDNIQKINFRYKYPSWTNFSIKIDYYNAMPYISNRKKDQFLIAYLNDYISRDSCNNCIYAKLYHQVDITMGDFWGYISDERKYKNDEKGISLLLLNTKKGEELFKNICTDFEYIKKPISEAVNGNRCLSYPYPSNKEKKIFWIDFQKHGSLKAIESKYLFPRRINYKHAISCFIRDNKYLIPEFVFIICKKIIAGIKVFNEK